MRVDRRRTRRGGGERKPVLVDLWATWCKNCLTMDNTTMEDASVKSALAGSVKIKYQAEDPDVPETKRVMQSSARSDCRPTSFFR